MIRSIENREVLHCKGEYIKIYFGSLENRPLFIRWGEKYFIFDHNSGIDSAAWYRERILIYREISDRLSRFWVEERDDFLFELWLMESNEKPTHEQIDEYIDHLVKETNCPYKISGRFRGKENVSVEFSLLVT